MGRRSLFKNREKRKKQKAKRKLEFITSKLQPNGAVSNSSSEESNSDDYGIVDDDYGVDSAVMEMRIEDDFKEQDIHDETCTDEYLNEYLIKCRQVLMCKVDAYQQELAHERLERKKLLFRTEEKIQNIQEFYRKMVLVPNCAGTILKKSLSSTRRAQQFLKELVTTNTILRP